MAKWKEKPWKRKGIYYPNAQRNKGSYIPQDRKRKKQKTRKKISNYMGYNKPIKRDNKPLLMEFARETRKARTRSERPEYYDEIVENWDTTPPLTRFMITYKTAEYYNSERVKDMIRRRKEASGTYQSPVDSKYYKDYVEPYLAIKEYNAKVDKDKRIEITKAMEEEFQIGARNWLSNRVSPEEFEQSFKVFEQGEELIKVLYENSKYVNTNVTLEDYKSAFYAVFRNALQKSKLQYDSNTIRTYLLSNGIDEYNDGDDLTKGITPERLDEIAEAINPKIGLVIADINQLNALAAGNEPPVKRRKAIDIKPKTKKAGGDERWFDDNPMQYFKGYKLGDMTGEDIEYISEILPTKNELLTVQKLLARARKKANIDFKLDTVDLYERAADVLEDYGSKLGIEELTNELIDRIDAMNILKYQGKWNN